MIQLILESLHHFYENIFSETLLEKGSFLEILKQGSTIHFPKFHLPTYFTLAINYYLTSITSNIDF